MASVAIRGRIPLRPDSAASFPEKKIVSYLSKNPVNLSVFIEFFGNSLSSSEATGFAMIPVFSSSPVPANAGKCGGRPRPGRALAPLAGGVEKPPERVMATPLKGKLHKGNPPYPPLTGGYKKAMRSRRAEGVLLFLAPLSRGGRGGWFSGRGRDRSRPVPVVNGAELGKASFPPAFTDAAALLRIKPDPLGTAPRNVRYSLPMRTRKEASHRHLSLIAARRGSV